MQSHSFKLIWIMICILLAVAACNKDEQADNPPQNTLVPGIEAPITINGDTVRVTEVTSPEQVGDRVPDVGFRLLEVRVEVSEGSPEEVSKWPTLLRDPSNTTYIPFVNGWGVFYGSANTAGWAFSVPEETTALWLVLPDGTSVDLVSLMPAD
jgi:hypothetical protein